MKGVYWYPSAFIKSYIGFFCTMDDFRKYVKKRMPHKLNTLNFNKDDSNAITYEIYDENKHIICVVMNMDCDMSNPLDVALVAHECVHVKQYAFANINEEEIGVETEAYFIQYYTGLMASDYTSWKKKNAVSKEASSNSSSTVDG